MTPDPGTAQLQLPRGLRVGCTDAVRTQVRPDRGVVWWEPPTRRELAEVLPRGRLRAQGPVSGGGAREQ